MTTVRCEDLPGLNCGMCGYRTCAELAERLEVEPDLVKRCIHLSKNRLPVQNPAENHGQSLAGETAGCVTCGACSGAVPKDVPATNWLDSLGRKIDFYLEHFPEDPGPREIIIPHNPIITRELNIQVGDVLIGRPLGMSCGCPITHAGVVMEVDQRTGVMVWCVTGPLRPRQEGYKDMGYYIAEGYEGLVTQTQCEVKIGMRYFFQPRMCMLQWRHSGLVNFINRTPEGLRVRLEGLWIG